MPLKRAKKATKPRVRAGPGLVGPRLRAARAHRGMSQNDFAIALGVYPTLVSKLENNDRTQRDVWTAFVKRILRVLNPPGSPDRITADYLLGEDEKMVRRP